MKIQHLTSIFTKIKIPNQILSSFFLKIFDSALIQWTFLNASRVQVVLPNPFRFAGCCASVKTITSICCNLCGNSFHLHLQRFSWNWSSSFVTISPHSQYKKIKTIDQKTRENIVINSILLASGSNCELHKKKKRDNKKLKRIT